MLDGDACRPDESGCPPQLLQVAIIIIIITAARAAATTTTIIIMIMMMMIIMIIIIIMIITITIIIVALKCANRDFYNLLTASRTVSNTYALVVRAQLYVYHVQHIERLPRATCRVPRGTKGQLSYKSLAELKSHLF